MDKIELSKHIKQGDTFYTPFTDPSGLGETLHLSSGEIDFEQMKCRLFLVIDTGSCRNMRWKIQI